MNDDKIAISHSIFEQKEHMLWLIHREQFSCRFFIYIVDKRKRSDTCEKFNA